MVLHEGGFRAAARQLRLSPSTIIEHINQLETDLAAPLLVRRRGFVEATTQGATFLPLARALIDTAERCRALIANAPLRLAASSNIGTYFLQEELATFRRILPCAVELWCGANPEVAQRLASGTADVALMEWWDNRPGFVAHAWRKEPLVAIVGARHPWAEKAAIPVSALTQEKLLGGEGGTGTFTVLKAKLGALAERLDTIDGFGSTEAVKRAVRAGHGISLVLASTVADEIAAGQLIALRVYDDDLETDLDLRKDLQIIVPDGLAATVPAVRFAAHVLRSANI